MHSNIHPHRVHDSKVLCEKIVEYGFKRAPHPTYSPDIAPSDFFFYFIFKKKKKNEVS
jgi:hypothetical protein